MVRETTLDCFTEQQKEYLTRFAAYKDLIEKRPRFGYEPYAKEAEFEKYRYEMERLAGNSISVKKINDALHAHDIREKFDFNNPAHRNAVIPCIVSHNDAAHLKHLSLGDYKRVMNKKLKLVHADDVVCQFAETSTDAISILPIPGVKTLNVFRRNFFEFKTKKITLAEVNANPELWETAEGDAIPKQHFEPDAAAQTVALRTRAIERNMQTLSTQAEQTSHPTASVSSSSPTDESAVETSRSRVIADTPTASSPSDNYYDTLIYLIGETASIEGFEKEETVTALYSTLQCQIENDAPYKDIMSTKTKMDFEKIKISKERKQFDDVMKDAGYVVDMASSLSVIFGNNRLAGQITTAGHSVLTIGNAFAGINGVGLLAAASPFQLGATLLSGVAGLVGLFREENTEPTLGEILIPMLQAISQQISQLRAEMHDRFNQVISKLDAMQHVLLESFMDLSRETKLTQEMVLSVIAKIDTLQTRQDIGFSQMHARFDRLDGMIENHAVQAAFLEIVKLKPTAKAKDQANYNLHFQQLMAAYGPMYSGNTALTGQPFERASAQDLQVPGVMLAQTLSTMTQMVLSTASPKEVRNPLALAYTTALLEHFIKVHRQDDGSYTAMTSNDLSALRTIEAEYIKPLRDLVVALRQVSVWDRLFHDYERSAATFKSTCENYLREKMRSHGDQEGLRLRQAFSAEPLRQPNDHETFMRQVIPIGLDYYPWRAYVSFQDDGIAQWNKKLLDLNHKNPTLRNEANEKKTEYQKQLTDEVRKKKGEILDSSVFMRSINPDFQLLLPLHANFVKAIPDKVHYLCAKQNFKIEFLYHYDEAQSKITIIGRLFSDSGLACHFFEKSFSNPLRHYKGFEALWWFWMGGNVPTNAEMTHTGRYMGGSGNYSHMGYWDHPVFPDVPVPALRDRIHFSLPNDQIALSEEIEHIYKETMEQEVVQLDAYHIALQTDAKDTATPFGRAFENLNLAYLMMKRPLEFLQTVSPSDIWQSSVMHVLNSLPSTEIILTEARRNKINPASLFAQEEMVMHCAQIVRREMQKQQDNSKLFFDDLLTEFFTVIEQCPEIAQGVASEGARLAFGIEFLSGIEQMMRNPSLAAQITPEQALQCVMAARAMMDGQIPLTRALMAQASIPQIAPPPDAAGTPHIPDEVEPIPAQLNTHSCSC